MIKAGTTAGRNTRSAFLKRLPLTTALGGLAVMSYGRSAYAGDCAGAGGTYLCTGAADPDTDGEILITRSGPLEVTTQDGFGVDRSRIGGASAILLRSEYGATFTTGSDVLIVADDGTSGFPYGVGLDVSNLYGGDVAVDTTGADVRGASGILIETFGFDAFAGSAGIDVTTGDVGSTTGGAALSAFQSVDADLGTGITIDTTAGLIASTGSDGIRAHGAGSAAAGTADIAITTGDVDAVGAGISALRQVGSDGYAGSSITINSRAGSIASTSDSGILVDHKGLSTAGAANVAVTSADVSGGAYGVQVVTSASGYTGARVAVDTTAGTVSGGSRPGIDVSQTAYSYTGAVDLAITTAAVTGATDGIRAFSQANGATLADVIIDSSAGSVAGISGVGIVATQNSYSYGGTADLVITAGDVYGGFLGIDARNLAVATAGAGITLDTTGGAVVGFDQGGIFAQTNSQSSAGSIDIAVTTGDVALGSTSFSGPDSEFFAVGINMKGEGYTGANIDLDTTAGTLVAAGGAGVRIAGSGRSAAGTAHISVKTGDIVTSSTSPVDFGFGSGSYGVLLQSRAEGALGADLTIDTSGGTIRRDTNYPIGRGIRFLSYAASAAGSANVAITTGDIIDTRRSAIEGFVFNSAAGDVSIDVDTTGGRLETANTFSSVSINVSAALAITTNSASAAGDGSLTVTTGDVAELADPNSGQNRAILLRSSNKAQGDVDIRLDTTGGVITGELFIEIDESAVSRTGSADIDIRTGAVVDGAIEALNSGTAVTSANITLDTTAAAAGAGGPTGLQRSDVLLLNSANVSDGTAHIFATFGTIEATRTRAIFARNRASAAAGADLGIDTTGGAVSSTVDDGIYARQEAYSAHGSANLAITTADVTGQTDGINASSTSEASENATLAIDSSAGSVVGNTERGIEARHYAQSDYGTARLSITAADVTGGTLGIYALNEASAYAINDLVINTVAGSVTGESDAGVVALHDGKSAASDTDLLITTADVTGATTGIYALNQGEAYGASDLIIDTVAGSVIGAADDGIYAANDGYSEAATSDLIIDTADVRGGQNGIVAINSGYAYGASDLIIDTVAGSVMGQNARGIDAGNTGYSYSGTSNLTITTANVTGGTDGIYATSQGDAYGYSELIIDGSAGSVLGEAGRGIDARQSGESEDGSTVLLITTANVSGGTDGIYAINAGSAYSFNDLEIDSTAGSVVGAAGIGIAARHEGQSSEAYSPADLVIFTADVTGGTTGILAAHYGLAANSTDLIIDTTAGSVVGLSDTGIDALQAGQSAYASAELSITSAEVFGATDGINAVNRGSAEYGVYLNIDSTYGSVTGQSGHGIRALQEGYSRTSDADLIITTADVSGGTSGINAVSSGSAYGSGDVIIDSSAGSVAGLSGAGIYALQTGQSSYASAAVSITTADVEAAVMGIDAIHKGSGAQSARLRIDTTAGSVTTETRNGIYARSYSQSSDGDVGVSITTGDVTSRSTDSSTTNPPGGPNYSLSKYAAAIAVGALGTGKTGASLTIDTTGGELRSGAGDGLYAGSSASASNGRADLTITTGDVRAGRVSSVAIEARQTATGALGADLAIDTTAGTINGGLNAEGTGILSSFLGIDTVHLGVSSQGTANSLIVTGDITSRERAVDAISAAQAHGDASLTIDTTAGVIFTDARTVAASNIELAIRGVNISKSATGSADTTVRTGSVTLLADQGDRRFAVELSSGATAERSVDILLDTTGGAIVGDIDVSGSDERTSRSGSADIAVLTGAFDGTLRIDGAGNAATHADIFVDTTAGGDPANDARRSSRIITAAQAGETVEIRGTFNAMTAEYTALDVRHSGAGRTGASVTLDTTAGALVGGPAVTLIDLDGEERRFKAYGIAVLHQGESETGAADLTLTTASVSGDTAGIKVQHEAQGSTNSDVSINTAAGFVQGRSGIGIQAVQGGKSDYGAAGLQLITADVTGATDGISALNQGDAYGASDLVIDTAAGSVVGQSGRGIEARHTGYSYFETADLTITTADVTGSTDGIYATSEGSAYGSSNLIIDTVAGSVTGDAQYGIKASQTGLSEYGDTDLLITTADVSGGQTGIRATQTGVSHSGSASLAITTGAVQGTSEGIFARNAATSELDANLTINTSAGAVTATNRGIYAVATGASASGNIDVTITTQDVTSEGSAVLGGVNGTSETGANITIDTIAGAIVSTTGKGIYTLSGSGVGTNANSDITITTGNVDAGDTAILGIVNGTSETGANITVNTTAGDIIGRNSNGIHAIVGSGVRTNGNSDITITTGDVTARSTAVLAEFVVGGYGRGSKEITIDTSGGTITSNEYFGIAALRRDGSGDIAITTADVHGYAQGIYVFSQYGGTESSNVIVNTTGGAVTRSATFRSAIRVVTNVVESNLGAADMRITTADVEGVDFVNNSRAELTADVVIDTTSGSVTAYGRIEGANGISGRNQSRTRQGSANLTITTADVTSNGGAINVENSSTSMGNANLTIDTQAGHIRSTERGGIRAVLGLDFNDAISQSGSTHLQITTAGVEGAMAGIFARNAGQSATGSNLVINTSAGSVSGDTQYGIIASQTGNSEYGAADLHITTADVSGGTYGVFARREGNAFDAADLIIDTSAGTITGKGGSGISAENEGSSNGTALVRVTTADVSGTRRGLDIENASSATGSTTLTIDTTLGAVSGQSSSGIFARQETESDAGDASLMLTTGNVSGGSSGVNAGQRASGQSANLIVDTTAGDVRGDTADGMLATNSATATAGEAQTVLRTGAVTGQAFGIYATTEATATGDAGLTIDSTAGAVRGLDNAGIFAVQRGTSEGGNADLTLVTADVTGTLTGIGADIASQSGGHTNLGITTIAGDVTGGENGFGILAANRTDAGSTTLTVGDVAGGRAGISVVTSASGGLFLTARPDGAGVIGLAQSGISAVNTGGGATRIVIDAATADARIAGGAEGIFAVHESAEAFTLDVLAGTVANLDGLSSSRAITARADQQGVALTIGQQGAVTGTLDLTDSDDVVTNSGRWNPTGGTSNFGDGTDVLHNTSSDTLVVGNGQPNQTTQFINLETFNNSGRIAMNDDDASGRLQISGDFNGSGNSLIAMNFDSATGAADMVTIGGDVTGGPTTIRLSAIGPEQAALTGFGQNDGLGLVEVAGTTAAGDFALAQTVQRDVFLYDDLVLGTDNMWRVQSQYLPSIPAYDAYPSLLLNLGAIATPISQQAAASRQQAGALWLDVSRSTARQGEKYSALDTSYRQNFTGVTLGVDYHPAPGLLTTLTVHYVDSASRVESPHGDARIETDGYGVGGQMMWTGADGVFVGMQGRLMLFNSALPGTADNDAKATAISFETGKAFAAGAGWDITPYAVLNYVNAEFDAFNGSFGETVALSTGHTVQGRLGLLVDRVWGNGSSAYAGTSLDHALRDRRRVNVTVANTHRFGRDDGVTALSLSAGGRIALGGNSFLTGDVAASRAFGATEDILGARANLGLRISW